MGSARKDYGDVNLNRSTRSEKESLMFLPHCKSCAYAVEFVRLASQEIRGALEKRMPIDCESITKEMRETMEKQFESGFEEEFNDNLPGDVSFSYAPKIEGGDTYNLSCKDKNKDKIVEFDTIQFAVGINYKGYYSNYIRTLLINPTDTIKGIFKFMVSIEKVIIHHLRAGVELSKVYESAVSFAENDNNYLANHLKKEFGFVLSPISQKDLVINSNTNITAQYGMTFAINIELIGLKEGERFYNLRLSDTILVRHNVHAEILTRFRGLLFQSVVTINNDNEREDNSQA